MKPRVVLFDIDGTLLLSGGAGRVAMEGALLEAFGRRQAVLSQLTVNLIRPLEVGARWIVMGWPFASDGRNLLGASAIVSESGELHALASAVRVCLD